MDDQQIRQWLQGVKRIAVVGLSDKPDRASYQVAQYLLQQGYEIIPVHPRIQSVFEIPAVRSLGEIDGEIDLVDIFRRSEDLPEVVEEALQVGAKSIWVQLGLENEKARKLAEAAEIPYIENHCIKIEHQRLFN